MVLLTDESIFIAVLKGSSRVALCGGVVGGVSPAVPHSSTLSACSNGLLSIGDSLQSLSDSGLSNKLVGLASFLLVLFSCILVSFNGKSCAVKAR